ncbi:glycosyl transferase [Clostridium acetobutylicum]|nr:glycosyl transferase [Clostridium acetobutylicum]
MSNEISLCMIVKNEEKYLFQCLDSVKDIVDEIIIVDTGSTDKTVEIAKKFGADIHYFMWNNSFSDARNESLKYATKDWIFIMDGDDEFSKDDKEKFKELVKNNLKEDCLYYFETLSYCGEFVDSSNISVNLNPRLFKNNYGYKYEGIVHNQLVNTGKEIKNVIYNIRIYHYGYLEDVSKKKNKRGRNIPLLKKQLKENPDDRFAHFNIGNEYYAIGDLQKALTHYCEAYKDFNPSSGFGFVLITRLIVTNFGIGEHEKAIKFADIGLEYYPNATDIYFLKALIYEATRRPTLAIKALKRCIEMGEPPSNLKLYYGTWSFKALYELVNIYMGLKDYEEAYKYCIETIKAKNDFVDPVYVIGHILKERKTPIEEFKVELEKLFSDYPKAYFFIANILYNEGYFNEALEYTDKCEKEGLKSDAILDLKLKAMIRAQKFNECAEANYFPKESVFYFNASMYKVLSLVLMGKFKEAIKELESFKEDKLKRLDKKELEVYSQFVKLFMNEETKVLSEDKEDKEYTGFILDICDILLSNKLYDEFEKALNLFNLISDENVLLNLSKLYYKHGIESMAKKEAMRSIKEFEVFDNEILDILR